MIDRSYIGKIAQRLASTVNRSLPSDNQMRGDIMTLIDQKLPGNHENQPFRRFEIDTGDGVREVTFDSFEDFCKNWLFFNVTKLQAMYAKDVPVRAALTHALKREPGNPTGNNQYGIVDNINDSTERPTGTSKDATLRRLRKDHPEQYQRVLNGELSANKAAIEAGFRRPTVQITDADPAKAAERIRTKLGEEFAQTLKEFL
jgi:hypothetical protein